MLIMRPRPRAIIPGNTACAHSIGPRTLTSSTRHHSAGSLPTNGPRRPSCPALLTSTSTGPRAASIFSVVRGTQDASVTSTANARASPDLLISAAVVSISDCVRARTATFAPDCARANATARPIPRPAPVTTATRPSKSAFIAHRVPVIPKQIATSTRQFPPKSSLLRCAASLVRACLVTVVKLPQAAARQILVVVVPPVDELDLVGPLQVFSAVNRLAARRVYAIDIVTTTENLQVAGEAGVLTFLAHRRLQDVTQEYDSALLVCGLASRYKRDAALFAWLKHQSNRL